MGKIEQRLAQIEQRAPASGPKGDTGEQGERGPPGERGDSGSNGVDGKPGGVGIPGERGIQGEAGPKGDTGAPGRDADPEQVKALVVREVQAAVGALPAPKDGKDGPQGDPGQRGEKGELGTKGEKGDPGASGEDGLDGERGRDGLEIEVLDVVKLDQSYRRGTWARYRGGIIRAFRTTDPGDTKAADEPLEKIGWHVIIDGIAAEEETVTGRMIKRVTTYTSGKQYVREYASKAMEYRQVWRDGAYQVGDVTTWAGSAWHCEKDTTAKPGSCDDWKMIVKAGRDGRDALAPPKPIPPPGRIKKEGTA